MIPVTCLQTFFLACSLRISAIPAGLVSWRRVQGLRKEVCAADMGNAEPAI